MWLAAMVDHCEISICRCMLCWQRSMRLKPFFSREFSPARGNHLPFPPRLPPHQHSPLRPRQCLPHPHLLPEEGEDCASPTSLHLIFILLLSSSWLKSFWKELVDIFSNRSSLPHPRTEGVRSDPQKLLNLLETTEANLAAMFKVMDTRV